MPNLCRSIVFKFLRCFQDHSRLSVMPIMINLVEDIIRKKMLDMVPLGRDFLRLLQAVSNIPVLAAVLHDLLEYPSKFSPEFDIRYFFHPTPREFLLLLIPPEIEFKIVFYLNNVPEKIYHIYLRRFMDRFIGESFVSDLTRYICCIVHPRNTILKSCIVQRWLFLRSIMSTIKDPIHSQAAKTALFFDWLFYTAGHDQFMTIEPSILVLYRSLWDFPFVSSNLIEFLSQLVSSYYPPLKEIFILNIRAAISELTEKKVFGYCLSH
jgi:integrator complex subunit 3